MPPLLGGQLHSVFESQKENWKYFFKNMLMAVFRRNLKKRIERGAGWWGGSGAACIRISKRELKDLEAGLDIGPNAPGISKRELKEKNLVEPFLSGLGKNLKKRIESICVDSNNVKVHSIMNLKKRIESPSHGVDAVWQVRQGNLKKRIERKTSLWCASIYRRQSCRISKRELKELSEAFLTAFDISSWNLKKRIERRSLCAGGIRLWRSGNLKKRIERGFKLLQGQLLEQLESQKENWKMTFDTNLTATAIFQTANLKKRIERWFEARMAG